jgi:hypothetical protein
MLEEIGNGTRETVKETGTKDADSKNKVFEAYDELLQKLKATTKTPTVIKQEEKVVEEKKVVVETAARETPDELAKHLISLKKTLNQSLDEIETKLNTEKKKFETLRQAVEIQNKELSDLYEIRPQADTLAALVMAYKEKSVSLEQEIKQKRLQWQREQEVQEETRKEYETQTQKSRQREEENYIYNRDIFRRKEQEEYEAQKRLNEQELTARRFELEEANKTREAALIVRESKIANRENDIKQLQEEVRNFPERLQQAAMDAERILAEKLEIKFQYEAKLLHKDFDVERELYKQNIAALEAKIKHLESLNYSFKPLAYNTDKVAVDDKALMD